jgi:hypothetical protein
LAGVAAFFLRKFKLVQNSLGGDDLDTLRGREYELWIGGSQEGMLPHHNHVSGTGYQRRGGHRLLWDDDPDMVKFRSEIANHPLRRFGRTTRAVEYQIEIRA